VLGIHVLMASSHSNAGEKEEMEEYMI